MSARLVGGGGGGGERVYLFILILCSISRCFYTSLPLFVTCNYNIMYMYVVCGWVCYQCECCIAHHSNVVHTTYRNFILLVAGTSFHRWLSAINFYTHTHTHTHTIVHAKALYLAIV